MVNRMEGGKIEACNKYLLKENFKENHSTELTKIP